MIAFIEHLFPEAREGVEGLVNMIEWNREREPSGDAFAGVFGVEDVAPVEGGVELS